MQRHAMTKTSKPQQKHRIWTVSKNAAASLGRWGGGMGEWGRLKSILRCHNPRP